MILAGKELFEKYGKIIRKKNQKKEFNKKTALNVIETKDGIFNSIIRDYVIIYVHVNCNQMC